MKETEVSEAHSRLRNEEDELYRKNNDFKSEITRNKKELERYLNRRDFLENKQRFFRE
jgi:hypothetical protein